MSKFRTQLAEGRNFLWLAYDMNRLVKLNVRYHFRQLATHWQLEEYSDDNSSVVYRFFIAFAL